jgi:hypothetical protein
LADDRSRRATLGRCLYLGASPPARYVAHHDGGMGSLPGRRSRLLEMVDLADMLGRVGELEAEALALVETAEIAIIPMIGSGRNGLNT